MPKIKVSDALGLHQVPGSGVQIESSITQNADSVLGDGKNNSCGSSTFGVHEVAVEVDLGGVSFTATDNGLVKTLLSFTENIRVLDAAIICSETISSDNTAQVSIATTSQGSLSADVAVTVNVVDIIDGVDLKSSATGTAGDFNTPAYSDTTAQFVVDGGASADKIVMMNKGTSNAVEAKTAGKFIFWMKFIGSSKASLLTTV